MRKNSIFDVDVAGLRELQAGKPKWHIVRELVANALDEEISQYNITFSYEGRKATIIVEDDSHEGFKDLAHAYTLFASTDKRANANQRGRFNMGEKQVICLCDYARIISTKGAVEFNVLKGERKTLRSKRDKGSEVKVIVKMNREEYQECVDYCKQILSPKRFFVLDKSSANGNYTFNVSYKKPYKIFSAKLRTELKQDGEMKSVTRETDVHLHKIEETGGTAFIFELGIPVCEIECDYSIDVQQKIPLSADRDKVDAKYLKTLYGEVLNQVHDEITSEQSSSLWVRDGFTSDRTNKDAVKSVMQKRFGEKALIANQFDQRSMQEALNNGYNLIHGSEMSKEEWAKLETEEAKPQTTTGMFGSGFVEREVIKPNAKQLKVADLCKKIAKEFIGADITVTFYNSPYDSLAEYDTNTFHLKFNVNNILNSWWDAENGLVKWEMLQVIISELGHSRGLSYERSYHDFLSETASKLAIKTSTDSNFLKL